MAQSFGLIPQVKVDRKIPEKCFKVGPFIMLETIGVGSTGKVKLCVHLDTLNHYACKVVEKSAVRQQMRGIQIQREIAILSRLRHKNTVSLVSVHSTATKIFIIMEIVIGGELYDEVLRLRSMAEPYARFFFRQLIDGLEYCHSHHIFHRDLKPDNLLVDVNRTLKITDFGLAALKSADDDSESVMESLTLHTRCGTPNYTAPEIVKGDASGYSGQKVDMWGCGLILFVLTAGRLPFDSPNIDRLALDIIRCDVRYPPYLSEGLVDLIKKLLHPNAKERYNIDDVRRHPWFSSPEPINLNDYPPITPKVVIGREPATIDPSPHYPYPKKGNAAKRPNKPPRGNNKSDDSDGDGRDSLDFGTRVEAVSTEVPLQTLKRLKELQDVQLERNAASGTATLLGNEQMVQIPTEPKLLPPRMDSYSRTLENLADEKHRYHMNMDLAEASSGPGNEWVDTDRDRAMWYQFMKDVDMISDVCEFGMDRATLTELWGGGLLKENIQRKNSFAANLFGVRPGARSPSEQDRPLLMNPEVEAQLDASTMPDERDRVTLWSKRFGLGPIPSKTGAQEVGNQHMSLTGHTVEQSSSTTEASREIPAAAVQNVPTQVNILPERDNANIQYDPFAASLSPNMPFQAPMQEMVDTEHLQPDATTEPEVSTPRVGSDQFIGIGQDLLEEYDTVEVNNGSNGVFLSNQGQAAVLAAESTEPIAVAGTEQGGGVPGSQALASSTPATTSGGSSTPSSGTESKVVDINPFAIDVPGPRRALPVTSTIVGSFVPNTISPKRLIRKSANPVDLKTFHQFHSILDPSSCFDVVLKVLREYGCRVRRTSSSRKSEKFQIRCESKKEGATIQTRVKIYKVDDFLCTVRFKRLLQTDSEEFNRFYSDVSQLYSEAVKKREPTNMNDTSLR